MARHKRKGSKNDRIETNAGDVRSTKGLRLEAIPRESGGGPPKSVIRLGGLGAVVLALLGGLAFLFLADPFQAPPVTHPPGSATFAGSTVCAECHRAQADLWSASQHRFAMQHAAGETVLGDFDDASFEYAGIRSRFFRRGGQFLVETDGPDGKLAVFEVKYTFGLDPLQQYLVEFPDGRLQALSIVWDSRPSERGGQRWIHLYPDEEIRHDDDLHWTKLNQNWNFMCAECHSTGVRKNYDAAGDRFNSTWAEISVGCEACHGQGSRHVAWARDRQSWWPLGKVADPTMGLLVRFTERRDNAWSPNATTGTAIRSSAVPSLRTEVETCGLCHARRGQLSEAWLPGRSLSDTHAVSTLARGLYHADGQMLDEVYNYGPFKQSRMFAAGVTCSDCHDPHSAKLRAPINGVCLQCHASDKYAATSHNRHERADPALTCASCHMPARTYMVIDRRHDHSFRVPRPDVSQKLGTPNACNDCHADRTAAWAASAIERWHGPNRKGFQTFGEAFHAAWNGGADSPRLLAAVAGDRTAPAIARASALAELGPYVSRSNLDVARAGLVDSDPMVRIGAMDMLDNAPAPELWPLASPLLSDPVRGVRIRAASLLAGIPLSSRTPADRERFERAAAEFVSAQRLNADRPEARTALGSFLVRLGRTREAEEQYRAALRLAPQFSPAAVNLADLLRLLGSDSEGEAVLREAIAVSPQDAALHHSLGLALTRLKQADAALAAFRQANELEPGHERYAYVYAVALHSLGRRDEALSALKETLARHPAGRETLLALTTFSRDAGDFKGALEYARRLEGVSPSPELSALVEALERQATNPRGGGRAGLVK